MRNPDGCAAMPNRNPAGVRSHVPSPQKNDADPANNDARLCPRCYSTGGSPYVFCRNSDHGHDRGGHPYRGNDLVPRHKPEVAMQAKVSKL